MVAQITFNPLLTSNAAGTFNTQSDGYIQGTALDQPSVRNSLAGGYLNAAALLPMWGGVGLTENIPETGVLLPSKTLGGKVDRASAIGSAGVAGSLTGFSVFDQNHAMINSPQSPVPLAAPGMQVNFYRFGSGARIAVAVNPALISLEGDIITSQVSWDFTEQMLVPYEAAYPADIITGATWAATNGGEITFTTTNPHTVGVGSNINISGFAPAAYNGNYITKTGTTGSTIVVEKLVDPGADTVQGQLDAGGGAVPCSVLDVQADNCMTVDYDPITGFATWSRNGACAIILI